MQPIFCTDDILEQRICTIIVYLEDDDGFLKEVGEADLNLKIV